MRTIVRSFAAGTALCAMVGQSWAAGVCARPQESMALKTAAMQQELMVAALYCNDVGLYNRFVVSFQKELQDSDAALLSYFQRAGGRRGATEYHSYKTALANDFSLTSLHGMAAYCSAAKVSFDAALNPDAHLTLAGFISSQPVHGAEGYATCDQTVAGGEMVVGGSSATRLAANRRN